MLGMELVKPEAKSNLLEEYCLKLFEMNFPKLIEEAQKTARENVTHFLKKLEEKIESKDAEMISQKLQTPNGQFLLNQSVQNAARFGHSIDIDLLVETVKQVLISKEDVLTQTLTLAADIIPKLTKNQLEMILVSFYIHELSFKVANPPLIELFTKTIFSQSTLTLPSSKEKNNLLTYGVFSFSPFSGDSGISFIQRKYPQIFESEIQPLLRERKMENLQRIINYYDKNESVKYVMTPAGSAIGFLLVKGIIPELDISILK